MADIDAPSLEQLDPAEVLSYLDSTYAGRQQLLASGRPDGTQHGRAGVCIRVRLTSASLSIFAPPITIAGRKRRGRLVERGEAQGAEPGASREEAPA